MEALQSMRVFTTAVQAGSFSAAGRSMGLSPASISRHISTLEETLGVRLINRTSRKLAPTQLGMLYFEKAQRILEQFDTLVDTISTHQESPRGLLQVHVRTSVGSHFLAPALPRFCARHPQVKVKLWLTEEPLDVIDHNIDVAIRLGNLDEPSLVARKLSSGVERILFASASYLEAHGTPREPEDLIHHNCLTFPPEGRLQDGNAAWAFRDGKGTRELALSGSMQVNNAQVLREAALAGIGIALLPAWIVAEDMKAGRLRRVLPSYSATPTTFDHSIYAVYHRAPRTSPKVRVFIDFLAEVFQAHEAEMTEAAGVAA
ncbi:MAG: LysR family transcriptional regulator [Rhodospirillaceae bacterium]|nr:LysR family transcriptional regulator [Rhodospirillaceae bacterium]